ncbi:hypothetical protein F183_A54840 (plasmid) [Bryobacterales bacterium F-183]|nr:hypothetical protein F183_A54840 [Bryobacterales bacterium F-183]
MELYYFKNREGNVGDDLNPYLWPSLIPDFEARDPQTVFTGIGTILKPAFFEQYASRPVVVFGTGSRGFYPGARFSPESRIAFVRGPLTATILGLPPTAAITDPAYALQLLPNGGTWKRAAKRSGVGFVPHYATLRRAKYGSLEAFATVPRLAKDAGVKLIEPTGGSVDQVLEAMDSCEHLICEAMHGAILADALRIPWTRVALEVPYWESESINEFKWNDWMLSIGTVADAVRLPRPPAAGRKKHLLLGAATGFTTYSKWRDRTAAELQRLKDQSQARLSSDATYKSILDRIDAQLQTFRR